MAAKTPFGYFKILECTKHSQNESACDLAYLHLSGCPFVQRIISAAFSTSVLAKDGLTVYGISWNTLLKGFCQSMTCKNRRVSLSCTIK